MRFSRQNPNTLVGIILLILLLVLVGPNTLPRLLSRVAPFADEGVPCARLRTAEDLANHQSLIGRLADNPITLNIQADPIPTTPDGFLVIRVSIVNNTIGTVPILFNPQQVLVGDNGSSGLGLLFEPANALSTGFTRQNQGALSFPESDIRLLGPRQRCVHRFEFPAAQLTANIAATSVRAYYRINSPGQVTASTPNATPIYPDQGLRATNGLVLSDLIELSLPNP